LFDLLHAHYDLHKHENSGVVVLNKKFHGLILNSWGQPSTMSIFTQSLPWQGVPHEVLTQDYWVPGSSARQELDRFRGKSTFQEILTTTSKTCMIYFQRVTNEPC